MGKIGRNEPCHCGSGKKYKNCHQQIEEKKEAKKTKLIIGGVVALVIIIIVASLLMNVRPDGSVPPGEAPPGKVWSPEHGHWHDAE